MEFISKYNMTFLKFFNKKYNKRFQTFDDYSLYLFELNECVNTRYYYQLEEDIKEYCKYQQERNDNYGKPKN